MPNFSQWTGCGHLGGDAESRPAGTNTVISFSIAVTRKRKDKESTTWFRCQWFGDRAVKVKEWLTKGKAVIVTGELYEHEFETKDGKKLKNIEVDVRDVVLLGGKEQAGPVKVSTETTGEPSPF